MSKAADTIGFATPYSKPTTSLFANFFFATEVTTAQFPFRFVKKIKLSQNNWSFSFKPDEGCLMPKKFVSYHSQLDKSVQSKMLPHLINFTFPMFLDLHDYNINTTT